MAEHPTDDEPSVRDGSDMSKNQQDVEKSEILDALRPSDQDQPSPHVVFLVIVLILFLLLVLLGLSIWWISGRFAGSLPA